MKAVSVALFAGVASLAFVHPVSAGTKAKESVLHSFGSGMDGQYALSDLLDVKGEFYGTTERGGTSGNGAVFALDRKTGVETVLYSFCSQQNCTDGQYPSSNLIDVHGTLYGTTQAGGSGDCSYFGSDDCGTVFAIDPGTGAETVVYSFIGGDSGDGWQPGAGLIDVKGTLYGTTSQGGTHAQDTHGYGTVFSLDPATGKETVLHAFCSEQKCADGGTPLAGLIEANGTLYGTTNWGGGVSNNGADSLGVVFAMDLKAGGEKVLHAFCSTGFPCTDGAYPAAGLIDVNGTLYGTTTASGSGTGCQAYQGCGEVFAVNAKTGKETVVYSFCSQTDCRDGEFPYAGLIDVKGTLYGTTEEGGKYDSGLGTVFAVDAKTGAETVLHSFGSGADGQNPDAGLTDVKGTLYGTTKEGGATGLGTVFAVKK
jgi:uncharacterized repeat protein (TIGR03803 family)